ncbi:hypothetical protein R3P38DRAFT_3184359 [Favolaschia claudopus]|uniref:Uncharacterized protein n=1 Tax=Favolaschia claudopus TaxID=2862362 RepID=A0AAW0C6G4_9AGAR
MQRSIDSEALLPVAPPPPSPLSLPGRIPSVIVVKDVSVPGGASKGKGKAKQPSLKASKKAGKGNAKLTSFAGVILDVQLRNPRGTSVAGISSHLQTFGVKKKPRPKNSPLTEKDVDHSLYLWL